MKIYFLVCILCLAINCTALAQPSLISANDQLITAVITRPWPGENYPVLPALPVQIRLNIGAELANPRVRTALTNLDAKRGNVEWFEGIRVLERENATWSLLASVVHPHDDVQIYALRSLERLNDKRSFPFLILYAKSMAVLEGGSENATLHGIIHETVAKTLSALTGVKVQINGQDPEKLLAGIKVWEQAYMKTVKAHGIKK